MILSIALRNWKTHEDTRLLFNKGLNLIVGVMGSGKSSVMDAISFALFGTYPALKRGLVKTDSIIMSRPEQKQDSEVSLEFSVGEDNYKVIRTLKTGRGSTATLLKNGTMLQTQPERVTEEVSSLLKIDYNVFSRAIYSEQNGISYFLDITKSERKRQIDNMLGLDEFAKAEERATVLVNSMRSALKDEEQMLSGIDIGSMEESYERLGSDIEKARRAKDGLSEEIKRCSGNAEDVRVKLESARCQYKRLGELGKEYEGTKSRIETIRNEISSTEIPEGLEVGILGQIEKKAEELRDLKSGYESITGKDREVRRAITVGKTEMRQKSSQRDERSSMAREMQAADAEGLDDRIKKMDSETERLSAEITAMDIRIRDTREWIDELNKHISVCPLCEREIDDSLKARLLDGKELKLRSTDNEVHKHRERLARLKDELARLSELKSRIESMRARVAEYGDIDSELDRLGKEIGAREAELDKITSALAGAERSIDSCNKEMERLRSADEKLRRVKRLRSELEGSEAKLKSVKEGMSSISVTEQDVNALHDRYSELSAALKGLQTKAESSDEYMRSMESQFSERKSELERMRTVMKRIKKRASQADSLTLFKKALGITSTTLRSSLIRSINELLLELWNGMYPYGDYLSIRINAENDDYVLEANTGNESEAVWVPINSVASGGERSIACLAMRIAIGMVIVPNLRWIILDEPTHNIDSNGIKRLADVFGSSLPDIVEQIFIITHDENLREISNAKAYVLERDKSTNAPTVVRGL